MNKNIFMTIGGFFGIICVLIADLLPLLGWWELTYHSSYDVYVSIDALGFAYNSASVEIIYLNFFFTLSGIVFLIGSVLIIISSLKKYKKTPLLSTIMMLSGLIIFYAALFSYQSYQSIQTGLSFLNGADYNKLLGSIDLDFFGFYSWRIGNGYIIAMGAVVISLVSSIFIIKER